MTPGEKKARQEAYLEYLTCCVVGEGLLTVLKPPETQLQAMLELYLYHLGDRRGGE
jgi:hypothetical protein